MKVYFTNLGCKLNQAELEDLARRFRATGFSIVGKLAQADLHVVNTCAVTHVAARDSRKTARRGRRLNPELRTVLTGCYVAADPQEAAALAGVDLVVANHDKEALLEQVRTAFPDLVPASPNAIQMSVPFVPIEFGNSRTLVKIEDGCDMHCAFCIIPLTRGRQRSRPFDTIVTEVHELSRGGFGEIVITGVQISSYRWGPKRLFDLVEQLLASGDPSRLRLTSIAPWQFDRRLFDLFRDPRLCRHLHFSLQSGCTETLKRMRRPYNASQFKALVREVKTEIPGIAITTDLIVGFPGETDEEFEESLGFVERVAFARVHAFPFSSRPGTEAASLPDQVPHAVKRQRMGRMLEIAEQCSKSFESQHLGSEVEVLWESCRDGVWQGTSDNYIRVLKQSAEPLANQLRRERLLEASARGVSCQETPLSP
ncbi:MAG: tRNA (N(6)-L-threonylcarbamoyladenosine(37)-C(2))-methylthiotransferase MtaB [Thermoanaerobaculia bacterium]